MSSEEFRVKIVSTETLLCMSTKLVFSIIKVHFAYPLHISIDIILFQYNFKSTIYDHICSSVDLLHWYDDGDWCWNGRSNQVCLISIFFPRKCLLLLLLDLIYRFLVLGLIVCYLVFISFSRFENLKNFVSSLIGVFFGNQIVCPNMTNYLSGRFFVSSFHVVFHLIYFSTREMFYNKVLLKFSSLWSGTSIYTF